MNMQFQGLSRLHLGVWCACTLVYGAPAPHTTVLPYQTYWNADFVYWRDRQSNTGKEAQPSHPDRDLWRIYRPNGACPAIQVVDVTSVHSMAPGRSMHVQVLWSDSDQACPQLARIPQAMNHWQLFNLGEQVLQQFWSQCTVLKSRLVTFMASFSS